MWPMDLLFLFFVIIFLGGGGGSGAEYRHDKTIVYNNCTFVKCMLMAVHVPTWYNCPIFSTRLGTLTAWDQIYFLFQQAGNDFMCELFWKPPCYHFTGQHLKISRLPRLYSYQVHADGKGRIIFIDNPCIVHKNIYAA